MPGEQPLGIDAAFQQGVRPSHDTPINAQVMVGMRGLRPSPRGAEKVEAITDLGWAGESTWSRYAKLHKGDRFHWLFTFWNILGVDLDTHDFIDGSDIIYNGTFGSGSGWSGANWAVSGGKAVHTAGATTAFTQSAANSLLPVIEFKAYRVTYTVSSRTAGTVAIALGNSVGVSRSTNATHTEFLRSGSGTALEIRPSTAFDGSIDNLSVVEIDKFVMDMEECGDPSATTNVSNGDFASSGTDWTVSPGDWTISASGAVHVVANTTTLKQVEADLGTVLTKGEVYRVAWQMTSTAGTVTPKLGSATGTAREGDGGFEEDIRVTVLTGGGTIDLEMVPSTDFNGTITLLSVKRIPRLTWPAALVTGIGQWDVADFGEVIIATRGDMVLARLPYFSNFRWAGFTLTNSTSHTTIGTIAAHMGRLWMGALDSDIFDYGGTSAEQVRWSRLWRVLMDRAMPGAFTHKKLIMDGKTAFISTPSGGDLDYPLVQELAMLGFPVRTEAAIQLDNAALDIAGKGEVLTYPLPWKKDIVRILPLGSGVVYYCGDGISYLEAPPEGGIKHVQVKKLGIANRGAVCGDKLIHTFIDQVGRWWRLKADLTLEMLDFKDDLVALATEANLQMTYDDEWGDVYADAGTTGVSYIVAPTGGWAELNTGLITGVRTDDGIVGLPVVRHGDSLFTFETNSFDMGSDWQKIVTSIYLSVLDATSVQCAVKYADDKAAGTFVQLPWVLMNPSNGVRPNTNGRAFRFLFKGVLGTRTKVERATILWRATEKKSVADPVNALTGYEMI